ncbi:hypothetical protein N0V95_006806 [Ascochyta clinopodiicola]|uniref:Biogenesis of lysosome-related organelles complex 1 subunit CNL1 n=1 Tax=Didymella rabiei TaxID=5454 RepID=A0A162WU81_DIDRA|nr:uncharacterized protein EKO05_0006410 [Ascochyta rabiei]KAJ4342866.1 hypothetical protein N0V95_006806 [Ascochyta clinopodiicola]KZM19206.1 hypothetical protein ST47_g9668 [Ascochyta rabiei]UPX15981.1 hypothetical protein EKO05_0006410 [Ascochyta rabiei]
MSTVRVSELGLNSSEQRYLQAQIATAASQQGSSSSRAASRASSQGRLLLDPTSLQALGAHFDRLMYSIQQRWQYLTQQTQTATQVQYDRAGNAMQMADAEIARFRSILREIDELQVEFDKVRRIGEIVKGFKARVDYLDRRF